MVETLDFPSDVVVPPGGSVKLVAIPDRPLYLLRLLAPDALTRARLMVDEVRFGMWLLILEPVDLLILRDASVFYDHPRWLDANEPVAVKIRSEEPVRSVPLIGLRFAVEERGE